MAGKSRNQGRVRAVRLCDTTVRMIIGLVCLLSPCWLLIADIFRKPSLPSLQGISVRTELSDSTSISTTSPPNVGLALKRHGFASEPVSDPLFQSIQRVFSLLALDRGLCFSFTMLRTLLKSVPMSSHAQHMSYGANREEASHICSARLFCAAFPSLYAQAFSASH